MAVCALCEFKQQETVCVLLLLTAVISMIWHVCLCVLVQMWVKWSWGSAVIRTSGHLNNFFCCLLMLVWNIMYSCGSTGSTRCTVTVWRSDSCCAPFFTLKGHSVVLEKFKLKNFNIYSFNEHFLSFTSVTYICTNFEHKQNTVWS